MNSRSTLIVVLALAVSGCQLDRLFEEPGKVVRPLGDGYFYVELQSEEVRKLGGPGSSSLRAFVDQEVLRSGICKSGHRLLEEGPGWRSYNIKGRCS